MFLKEESDDSIIMKMYENFIKTYKTAPLTADYLRNFASNYKGVNITWSSAKRFLDRIRAIENKRKMKLRLKSAMSSPMLLQLDCVSSSSQPTYKPMDDKLSPPPPLNMQYSHGTMVNFAFYNMTDIEILHIIKHKVIQAVKTKDLDSIESSLHMIWEREFLELEKRLHRQYILPSRNKNGLFSPLAPSKLMKRDKTFMSLKEMSQSTDVADV